jgi:lipopolysaccharide transport protein LptA
MPNVAMKRKTLPKTTTNGLCFGIAVCCSIIALQPTPANAVELPALDEQDTIVVTADQAWESDDGEILNFEGNFELTAPDYFIRSDTAQIHGAVEAPSRIVATGSPVTFWVRVVGSDERTHGQGQRVEYDRDNNLLRVTGEAVLRDDKTVMRSSLLEYDTATERLVSTGTDGVEIVTQPNRD